jgi:hypothetical protein
MFTLPEPLAEFQGASATAFPGVFGLDAIPHSGRNLMPRPTNGQHHFENFGIGVDSSIVGS